MHAAISADGSTMGPLYIDYTPREFEQVYQRYLRSAEIATVGRPNKKHRPGPRITKLTQQRILFIAEVLRYPPKRGHTRADQKFMVAQCLWPNLPANAAVTRLRVLIHKRAKNIAALLVTPCPGFPSFLDR